VPFSQDKADSAVNFFEYILKHTADEWWGKPFYLCPWQEEALEAIFGRVDDDGKRVIEMVYLEVPKKTGKTEFVAGIVLLVLVLSDAPGCQVYGAAAATRQALNVYRAACKMVEQSPTLKKRLRIMRGTNRIVRRDDPDSFYAAIAADGDLGDGVNPAFFVADEVHRWKTRKQLENWDVLSKGGITRKQMLTIAITTAGVRDESPLAWRLHEKTRRIQEGIVTDDRFFGRIYGAGKNDDPGDPATWIKANPSLIENGGFLEKERIRKEYESALSEGDLTSFRRYFLNIWDQKEDRALDMAQWDASSGDWEAKGLLPDSESLPFRLSDQTERLLRTLDHDLLGHFVGRKCWAGVDLSMTTDMTALGFVFPNEDGESYDVLPFFWLPEARLRRLEIKLSVPLKKWSEDGWIEVCSGAVIDYRDMRARLEWGASMFDLQEIAWDPWNSRQISVPMIERGFKCVEVRQGYQSLSEATKKIIELVVAGKLRHGKHPVLRWQAGCAATITDGRDNKMFAKPDREKSTARIDGIAAIANAMARVLAAESNTITYTGLRSIG